MSRILVPLVALCLLAGCGDGGGDPAPTSAAPAQPASVDGRAARPSASASNSAPTLSGAPATRANEGIYYEFVPEARDADGDALSFSVENLPAWARFDAATGRLHGTPGARDIGRYRNISISVSDGALETQLAAFSISVEVAAGGAVTVSWLPPTENIDDSPLVDLAGYHVYWGSRPDDYPYRVTVENPAVTAHVVDNLSAGTYYFATTAFNANRVESTLSEPAMIVIN